VIVDAGGGDVRVAEPFLDLGDVSLVVERIGGRRRAQRMGADGLASIPISSRSGPWASALLFSRAWSDSFYRNGS